MGQLPGRVRPPGGPPHGGIGRDAARAVDAEVDRAFPGLRDIFQATLVHAEGVVEASQVLDKLRAEIVALVREIGIVQTGRGVDMRWIREAAALFVESANGLHGFDLFTETDGPTLRAAVAVCKAQLKADREAIRDKDQPF